jgi:hypothetical protein
MPNWIIELGKLAILLQKRLFYSTHGMCCSSSKAWLAKNEAHYADDLVLILRKEAQLSFIIVQENTETGNVYIIKSNPVGE